MPWINTYFLAISCRTLAASACFWRRFSKSFCFLTISFWRRAFSTALAFWACLSQKGHLVKTIKIAPERSVFNTNEQKHVFKPVPHVCVLAQRGVVLSYFCDRKILGLWLQRLHLYCAYNKTLIRCACSVYDYLRGWCANYRGLCFLHICRRCWVLWSEIGGNVRHFWK